MPVLFPLLTIYTLSYLGLMVYDFVAREGFAAPGELMAVYVTLLGVYAADKEVRRWIGHAPRSRGGAWFVYAWMLFLLVAVVIKSFVSSYALPEDLVAVSLQVLGVLFGTKASKVLYEKKQVKPSNALPADEAERVLALYAERDELRRTDVEQALGVGRGAANRILNELEAAGKVQQVGVGRGVRYVLVK